MNQRQLNDLTDYLKIIRPGNIVYPGVVIRKTGLNMRDAYSLLDEIEKFNFIFKVFEIVCPRCSKYTGEIYDSLNDIPDVFLCDSCDHEFSPLNSIVIVYKMKSEMK